MGPTPAQDRALLQWTSSCWHFLAYRRDDGALVISRAHSSKGAKACMIESLAALETVDGLRPEVLPVDHPDIPAIGIWLGQLPGDPFKSACTVGPAGTLLWGRGETEARAAFDLLKELEIEGLLTS